MKKKSVKIKIIAFIILVLALFAGLSSYTAEKTFKELKSNESFDEVDYYSMQKYSEQNKKLVFSALKSGKLDKLKSRMISSDGIDEVLAFADWSQADFDNAVSLGDGSLSPKPDADGRMDMSERVFVDAGETRYVFFIESISNRWGRTGEGISAVAVTTYSHFDTDLDWDWCGEKDDSSVLAGKLFWIDNQPPEPTAEGE